MKAERKLTSCSPAAQIKRGQTEFRIKTRVDKTKKVAKKASKHVVESLLANQKPDALKPDQIAALVSKIYNQNADGLAPRDSK